MKNIAKAFAHLAFSRRRVKPEPLEVRRSNVNRRLVTVSYKPWGYGVTVPVDAFRILRDMEGRRSAGVLHLKRPAPSRPYLHTERMLIESAAALTR